MRSHDAAEGPHEVAHRRHEGVVIVIVLVAVALVVIVRLLTRRLLREDGVGGLQAVVCDGREGVGAAELDDRLDALARLPDHVLRLVLHHVHQRLEYDRHRLRGVGTQGTGSGNVALLPRYLAAVILGQDRHDQTRHGVGDLRLDERVPIVCGLHQDRHGLAHERDEGGSGVHGHLSECGYGALLRLQEGRADMHDQVAPLVLFVRIVQGVELPALKRERKKDG